MWSGLFYSVTLELKYKQREVINMAGYYGNPYFPQNYQSSPYPLQNMQAVYQQRYDMQQVPQPYNQGYVQAQVNQNQIPLQGKMVDSIDVVKAYDVPLTGEPVFFPKIDLSEIYTKQIQPNGTSKTNIYRLVEANEPENDSKEKVDYSMITGILNQFKQDLIQEVSSQIAGIKDILPLNMTEKLVQNNKGGNQR